MSPLYPPSPRALLRALAPQSQAVVDAPAHRHGQRSKADVEHRLKSKLYLWDNEARDYLGEVTLAISSKGNRFIEFASDSNGCRWFRVPRQVEWRMNLRALMIAEPKLRRGDGLPDWDPEDFWAPIGEREEGL